MHIKIDEYEFDTSVEFQFVFIFYFASFSFSFSCTLSLIQFHTPGKNIACCQASEVACNWRLKIANAVRMYASIRRQHFALSFCTAIFLVGPRDMTKYVCTIRVLLWHGITHKRNHSKVQLNVWHCVVVNQIVKNFLAFTIF